MIKHIVLWKLKNEANGKSKSENAALMKAKLESMSVHIPELHSVEVGLHMYDENSDMVCDVVLIAECENEEDLHAYSVHPEHKKVVEFIVEVVEERRVIDVKSN